jgi:transmembrane sensor
MAFMTGSDTEHNPIQEQAIDWLLKIEAAPDGTVLRAALAAWRERSPAHEQAYRSVTRVWRLAGDLPAVDAERAKASPAPTPALTPATRTRRRQNVRPASGIPAGNRPSTPRRRTAIAVMAAALAACLGIVLASVLVPAVQLRIAADHITGVGEIREIVLGDASRLHLDGASAVAVRYGPAERTVRLLAGQAFFDVAPDPTRPFIVHVDGFTVTVTGTAFAVGNEPDGTALAVQSGAVTVALGREAVRLVAGDRLSVARATGAVARSTVTPADVARWRTGRLVVDGVPLAELVAQLRRHHRGLIWLNGAALAERRITGVFTLSDPVTALKAAAATQGAEVIALTPYLVIVTPRRDL